MDYRSIATWDLLQKKMVWEHLKFIRNKRVFDFGSGTGMTANHFAKGNEVIAIEPDEKMLSDRFVENDYVQNKRRC
jgi:16S rRNA A1518/A1519 N6-dimethyltransferase RsmA/KsgA/DIM1 with predicted DNA glycosylase/AP lyase activity